MDERILGQLAATEQLQRLTDVHWSMHDIYRKQNEPQNSAVNTLAEYYNTNKAQSVSLYDLDLVDKLGSRVGRCLPSGIIVISSQTVQTAGARGRQGSAAWCGGLLVVHPVQMVSASLS